MKKLSSLTGLIGLAAFLTIFATAGLAAEADKVVGLHEVMDPNSRTDDLGVTVPVPISHPGRRYPAYDDFPTGPDLGESLPEFTLQNQYGESVDFTDHRNNSRAVVVFYRSVVW
jgi:hypothetical protein